MLCAARGSKFGELFMAIGYRGNGTFVFTSYPFDQHTLKLAACMGFAGTAMAILGADVLKDGWQGIVAKGFAWGYLPALGSAFIWASYSLKSKRLAYEGRGFPRLRLVYLAWSRAHCLYSVMCC